MWDHVSRIFETSRPNADAIIQRMAKLTADGRVREAISFGARQNERLGSHLVSTEIVKLRNLAFKQGAPSASWPPAFPDLFKGASGIPEIEATDLSSEVLGSAIRHHGSLIIRGLIPEDFAAEMRERIDRAMAECKALRAEGREWETGSPWYSRNPATQHHPMLHARHFTETGDGSVLAGDSPQTFEKIIAKYESMGVFKAVEGYIGERPALSLGKTVLRRIPITNGTDWHQDGAFLGADIRVVNLWVTLSDCGIDAAGLDVIAKRFPNVLETGTQGAQFDWSVGPGLVDSMQPPVKIQTPVFRAGDAMMFDQFCLHRTGIRPGMTKERYAIESWMFAPSTFPMEQFPLFV